MGCLKSMVKYSLFGVNLFFTMLGLAITIATIVLYLQYQEEYETLFEDELNFDFGWLPIALGILGISMFIIAFSGCWGSVTTNKFFLILFIILMLPLIGGKLYIVSQFNNLDQVERLAETHLEKMFQNTSDVSFHSVEFSLHCCGIKVFGPDSYRTYGKMTKFGKLADSALPPTCCTEKVSDFDKIKDLIKNVMDQKNRMKNGEYDPWSCTVRSLDLHKDSCSNKVRDLIRTYGRIILIIMFSTIAVEVIEVIAALFLLIAGKQTNGKECC